MPTSLPPISHTSIHSLIMSDKRKLNNKILKYIEATFNLYAK